MGSVEREVFCNSRCDSKKNSIARTIPFIQGKFVFPEFLRKCTAQNHQVLVSLANNILPWKVKGDGLKCSGSLDQCCVKAFLSFSTLEATDEAEAGLGLG